VVEKQKNTVKKRSLKVNETYSVGIAFLNGKYASFHCISSWYIEKHCLCLSENIASAKYIPLENIDYFNVNVTDGKNKIPNCGTESSGG
jgi:hypothetical protein